LARIRPANCWRMRRAWLGVHLQLPGDLSEAEWFGTGPLESYPDGRVITRPVADKMSCGQIWPPYAA
jgi:Beta galactosidase small chain